MQHIMLHEFAVLIQSALDVVLPRKERTMRIDEYRIEDFPILPQEHEACGVRITTLMPYRAPAVEDTIRALKYDRSGRAANLLASALAEYLQEEIASIRAFSMLPVMLVPVPLHASRERERGFNQIERMLRALPDDFHEHIETGMLMRTRATEQQTRLPREERLRNVEDAFALAREAEKAHVILVDDVTTTGATLAAAAKPFEGAASLTLLALARA